MTGIKIISQYIKDLSFESPSVPKAFLDKDGKNNKPDINISIDIDAKKTTKDMYEVTLKVSAKSQVNKKEELFKCDLSYAGIFSIGKIENDMLEQVLLIYCPNLIFPFLRRILANIVADAGFSPLMLDPIDFAALYARKKAVAESKPESDMKN